MSYKPGDRIIRRPEHESRELYSDDKDWVGTIVKKAGISWKVNLDSGRRVTWHELYFTPYTKLHKALK